MAKMLRLHGSKYSKAYTQKLGMISLIQYFPFLFGMQN